MNDAKRTFLGADTGAKIATLLRFQSQNQVTSPRSSQVHQILSLRRDLMSQQCIVGSHNSDLSRGLVTTDQSGSSFFEDSYISPFFFKNLLGYHPSKSICGVFINDLTTEQTCHKGIVTRPYTFWIRFPFPCGVFFKLMF